MKKRILAMITAVVMAAVSMSFLSYGAESKLLAFPGAEGGGKYAMGARANDEIEIYHVTNLNDSGEGSLRDAVSVPGRIVVFDVDGAIHLNSQLLISGNTTILGQTAPGEGITITGSDVLVASGASNVIIRYIRVRPTDDNGGEPDGLGGRWNNNVIIDHCSVSWSVDETITLYAGSSESADFEHGKNLTVQNCIVSESLRMSSHIKGAHGYGGIVGGDNFTFHHNLMAHHDSRTPRVEREVMGTEVTDNIIYNWGYTNSAYGGEPESYHNYTQGGSSINYTNNYYSYGPSTRAGKDGICHRIFDVSNSRFSTTGLKSDFYFNGNYVYGYPDVTADNTNLDLKGVNNVSLANLLTEPYDMGEYALTNQETAEEARETVLANAGATLPKRDAIDARVVSDAENMTGRIINNASETGGMIDINTGNTVTRVFAVPEEWKAEKGLSAYAENEIIREGEFEGYALLEAYVNDWTAAQAAPTNPQITVVSPAIASVNKTVNGYDVDNGSWAVVTEGESVNYHAICEAVGGSAIVKTELYDQNELIKSYGAQTEVNDDITLEAGTHFLSLRAYNEKGEKTQSTTSIVYVKKLSEDLGEYSFIELGTSAFKGQGGVSVDADGNYTIYGAGYLVSKNNGKTSMKNDSCAYMYKAVTGDFDEWVRVDEIPKFENRQNNGIMFRESLNANARMGMITDTWVSNGENDKIIYRTTTGAESYWDFFKDKDGNTVENGSSGENHVVDKYMRVVRQGDDITFYTSTDGVDWENGERAPMTINYAGLADTVYVGYAVDNSETLSTKPYFTVSSFSFKKDEKPVKAGDIDGNDIITANDAAALNYYILNNEAQNPKWNLELKVADLDGDGEITANDAAIILSKVIDSAYVYNPSQG